MSSYRNDNGAGYDRTLLSSVPDPTRAEKQEGYNVDLLDEGRDRRVPTPPNGAPTSEHHGGSTMGYSPGARSYARKEENAALTGHETVVTKVPWYRTRRSMIGIALIVLVVIGAVVGGVVGGTQSGKKHNNSATTSKNSSSSGQQSTGDIPQQGQLPPATASVTSSGTTSTTSGGVGIAPISGSVTASQSLESGAPTRTSPAASPTSS